MQGVNVLGVSNPMEFPDDMSIDDIREFLRKKFTKQMVEGTQPVELGDRPQMMQAYEPTLQEKTANAIGEGLHSSGIISDRFGAQRIGENVSNIAAFSPAGAAFGGDEFGRATKKGDKLGMALGALEGAGIGGDIAKLAIFGGVLAKSADLGALAKARKLEDSGADRDEIWKETGWANDNGDWKFEIDDSQARLKDENFTKYSFGGASDYDSQRLGDVLDADALNAYPELAGYKQSILASKSALPENIGGAFEPNEKTIRVAAKNFRDAKSTTLHELNHAIQQAEGFESGGSPARFEAKLRSAKRLYPKYSQAAEIRGLLDEGVAIDDIPDIYKGMPEKDYVMSLLQDPDDLSMIKEYSLDELNTMASSAKRDLNIDPHAQYERLAGEAEARNVQTRMDWTPEQRRATPPWKSLDVPEEELIYRKSGGDKAMSVPDSGVGGLPMGAVKPVTSYNDMFDFTPEQMAQQLRSSNPKNVIDGVYVEPTKFGEKRFNPDGSIEIVKDGKVLRKIEPQDSDMAYKNKIMKNESEKPEVKAAQDKRKADMDAERMRQKTQESESYKMQHTAPTREDNSSGDNLTDTFGGDIYSGKAKQYYGTGSSYDDKAINIIQSMRGNPEKAVTIYRAVPKSVNSINATDWVTTTREYAKEHMAGEKGWHILSKKVKAKDIATDGNSIHEFGYDPAN